MPDKAQTSENRVHVDLTHFVAGYPGSDAVPMFNALFRVMAVLVYRGGVAVDWVIRPEPDLSDIAVELLEGDHQLISHVSEAVPPQLTGAARHATTLLPGHHTLQRAERPPRRLQMASSLAIQRGNAERPVQEQEPTRTILFPARLTVRLRRRVRQPRLSASATLGVPRP
jgi:hypothetical protein